MGDIHAYFHATLASAGVPADLVPTAFERIWARNDGAGLWSRPMEGAADAVRELGRLGIRCAVVSNSDGRAARHLTDAGMHEGFEFIVDSHLVGVEKPDPRIFALALDRMGVPAGEALYIGDIQSVDSAGARGAGMHFVLIDPWGDYARPGVGSVRGIADLPDYLSANFTIVADDAGGAQAASSRSVSGGTP
jgi:putative hydrolase of the HAD superfamily